MSGCSRRACRRAKATRQITARSEEAGPGEEADGVRARPVQDREEEGGDADREGDRARQVERVAPRLARLDHLRGHEREGEEAERQVDREDGTPAEGDGEERAEERSGEAREAPDAAEEALDLRALLDRVEVSRDGERDGHQAARPEALQRPGADELRHRAGERADERAAEEEGGRDEEDPPAAVEVGQAPEDRHRDRGGEEVDGEDPRVERQAVEVPDDRGHRRRDDRRLEGGERGHQDERERHRTPASRVESGRRRGIEGQRSRPLDRGSSSSATRSR